MRNVIQRVKEARVEVNGEIVGSIPSGLLILVGIESNDTLEDIKKAADKIAALRIFEDEDGKMNRSLIDSGGSILSVSQFTLAGSIQKGNRPSFINAKIPEEANKLYEIFNDLLRNKGINVATGRFQEHMNVIFNNDGPVTIIVDIKDGKVL